eukprot:TRINITY_DN4410_c0_g1_i1.p1 TRINITY_DN4410_c0_g1~~TRINITY_DN4410_c0_g1_i1.p1  ORF type:complete len:294 (-),score=46.06 TRINITY_DN4410_c0_g1_i1:29-910(-)
MGRWMCQHLIDAGYDVTVLNRTEIKTRPLVAAGAKLATTARELGSKCDIVFSIVGFPKEVKDLTLGSDGILASLKPDSVFVDMTTSEPSLAQSIWQAAADRKIHALDAPVSGGDVGARTGQLTVMVGGSSQALDTVRPVLKHFSKTITHFGRAGSGQHAKMMNQILIASNMVGLVEGILYGQRAGLDLRQAIATLKGGAAGSWSLENYGPRILDRNFQPGFIVEHFIKDMSIALQEGQRMGLALPGLALAQQLYIALQNLGHGRKGTHALMLALETINGISDTSPAPTNLTPL